MIPANHRSMARPASQAQICTAALYSVPGNCRCPKCNSPSEDRETNPTSAAVPPAASAAAVRCYDPPAADGGNNSETSRGSGSVDKAVISTAHFSRPTPDARFSVVAPGDTAADRGLTPFDPIGGLSDSISAAPYPAPKPLTAARFPVCHDHPGGGPFLQEPEA